MVMKTMVMGTSSVERFSSFLKYTDTDQRHALDHNGRCQVFMAHYNGDMAYVAMDHH